MNIKYLEYFLAVVDEKTMSAAALVLFTSQPNVSYTIAELEKFFDTQLFYRDKQQLTLTPKGQLLESDARILINQYKQLNAAMNHSKPTLRVGATITVGHYYLEDYIKKIKSIGELDAVEVIVDNTSEIEKKLLDHQIQLAFVEGSILSSQIIEIPVDEDELIAVICSKHPVLDQINELKDLESIPRIGREEGSQYRNQFDLELIKQQIRPHIVYSSTNLETVLQAVVNGYGFAIVSKIAAKNLISEGLITQIKPGNYQCKRTIRLVYHKMNEQDPLIQSIIKGFQTTL